MADCHIRALDTAAAPDVKWDISGHAAGMYRHIAGSIDACLLELGQQSVDRDLEDLGELADGHICHADLLSAVRPAAPRPRTSAEKARFVQVKGFKDYVNMYVADKVDSNGDPLKVAFESVSDRWEIAVAVSDDNFQQVCSLVLHM